MIVKTNRWHRTAIAASAATLLSLWGSQALALSLGRITVQSALGEPLRAEVDVPDINAAEASSLKASVASPDAFRAAGMDYNAAMPGVQISLQRRSDGRAYLRLSSARPINEPFVDLILEAKWATGRLVRDYTMLLDPAGKSAPVAVTAPAQSTPAEPAAVASAKPASTTQSAPAEQVTAAPATRSAAPAAVNKTPKPVKAKVADAATASAGTVKVKPGDTASKIAAAIKPSSVSLDQMLVALLQGNPDAFIGGNMNRLKSGSVVNVPSAEQIESTSASEASKLVLAQSKDFNNFRRKLAANAPVAQVGTADRKATGTVQAKVEDKKPSSSIPDKLTLSKGTASDVTAEAKLAKERADKEAAERSAELAKNIKELNKLGAASGTSAPAVAASVPAVTVVPPVVVASAVAPASVPVIETRPPAVAVASAPASVVVAPPAPASAAVKPPPVVTATPPKAESSFIDQLLENPLLPIGAGGLLALLAGFGLYRARQRKNVAQLDSSYLESRLQPDSFFGASGGQRVDTKEGGLTGSSEVYSPSQLEAADDVDPVAEADVYLAYGRDLQAEEILKEALRANSGRIAIHQKLLEIYAKRQDTKNFQDIATQAHKLTQGDGAGWERICELGLSIDPNNKLYQPGSDPASVSLSSRPVPFGSDSSYTNSTVALPVQSSSAVTAVAGAAVAGAAVSSLTSVDLDLDFSLDDAAPSAIAEAASTQQKSAAQLPVYDDLDLSLPQESAAALTQPPVIHAPPIHLDLPDLDLDSGKAEAPSPSTVDLAKQAQASFGTTEPAALSKPAPREATHTESGMLEFDLGSLSLDLEDSTEHHPIDSPMTVKLSLAEEFIAIGDVDGARALITEVINEATGDEKIRAQRALNELI